MPSTKVSVRVPLCGSRISQRPTTKVRSAQARRARKLPTPWAAKAAAARKALTMTRTMPTKTAAPSEKSSGSRIAIAPMTIAAIPIARRDFQVRARPSRTSGSSWVTPPDNSIRKEPYVAARTLASSGGRTRTLSSRTKTWRAGQLHPPGPRSGAYSVLARTRHLAAAGARLERRAAGRGDAEDAHRFEPEAELLAALGRGDVVAAELAHALQPVADRVAVGEELFGGRGDVAVVVEVGLDRGDQLGLVLLVVVGERLDRLGVEAFQLGRVVAHRRQQQAVGAGVLEGEQRPALGLADVDREARLRARPVEIDRVGGAAAAADRDVEAGEAVGELAGEAGGGAGEALVVLGGDEHRHFGGGLGVPGRRQGARRQRAQRAQGEGEDAAAPLPRLGGARGGAQDEDAGAAVEVGTQLGAAGDDVAAIGDLAREDVVDEGARDLLARPFG